MFKIYITVGKKSKTKVIAVLVLITLLSINYVSVPAKCLENKTEIDQNPWTPEDEGDHFPCGCEWWMFYVGLELEDGTHWDASATFQYETKQTENGTEIKCCILLMYYFDRERKKCHEFSTGTNKEIPFSFKKNMVDLKYYNCTMKGLYPNYTIHLEDDEKTFILDIKLNATSLPHWAAQEGGNGYFPWGLGLARYGYISRLDASGTITIEAKRSNVTGVGYFEHAWGNFTYLIKKPLSKLKEFMKNIPKLLPLARWFFSEQTRHFPDALMFSTDKAFGYDWTWATFDNGWSLHFGVFHMLDRIAEGPVFGVLSLTSDGETYWDFADVNIKYGKRYYIYEADAYLPLDIEVTAYKGDKILRLRFNSTTEPHEKSIGIWPQSRFTCGFAGIQTAGVVEGYYQDSKGNVPLHGICTIGPFRHLLTIKNNELKIEFLRPPKGLGFSVKLTSYLLGLELFLKRQWLPYIERHFYIKPFHEIPQGTFFEKKYQSINSLTLYVGGDGPNNYTRIQDAIDNASNGDTVFVYNGTYNENLLVNKSIHLIGENKTKVFLNAGNNDGIKVIADNVEITGFTIDIEKADRYNDSAIDISSSSNLIHDNNIIKSEWYGIFIFNASNNIIEHNNIVDNDIGIWLCRSYNNIIRYNSITLSKCVGIWLWPFSKNNIFSFNNFIENKINSENSDRRYRNKWKKNYWDDYIGLKFKRLIDWNNDGTGFIPYRISRFERDWRPSMEPYNI